MATAAASQRTAATYYMIRYGSPCEPCHNSSRSEEFREGRASDLSVSLKGKQCSQFENTANAILAIHRVYDSAVACFQLLMNSNIESIDMWAITTNDRGFKIAEWVIHSYVRATPTEPAVLAQHGVAGIHSEERIAPLRVPDHKLPAAQDIPAPATLLDPLLEEGLRYSP